MVSWRLQGARPPPDATGDALGLRLALGRSDGWGSRNKCSAAPSVISSLAVPLLASYYLTQTILLLMQQQGAISSAFRPTA